MPVAHITPEGLLEGAPYHHVAVATGTRHVHVSGQVATGAPVVPEDLSGQVAQALRNVHRGLAGAGAGYADVVRLTFYVARWAPEQIADLMTGIESVATELALPQPLPPASLIGVEALFEPDFLVEVEATAILD